MKDFAMPVPIKRGKGPRTKKQVRLLRERIEAERVDAERALKFNTKVEYYGGG